MDHSPLPFPSLKRRVDSSPSQSAHSHYPILLGLEGPLQGSRFILNKQTITIGRDMLADIVLKDGKVSRQHARVAFQNINQRDETPQCRIFDEGSVNGTYVNYERVLKDGAALNDQDRIQIGRTVFGFYISDEEQSEQPTLRESGDGLSAMDLETGILNFKVFARIFPREHERARRYQRDLSMIQLTVENLPLIKERYGQQAKAQVLRRIGQILVKTLRTSDIVSRHQVCDIVMLLPETPLANAAMVAGRILKKIKKTPFAFGDVMLEVHVNMSASSNRQGQVSLEEMNQVCLKSLQAARERGGDMLVVLELEQNQPRPSA